MIERPGDLSIDRFRSSLEIPLFLVPASSISNRLGHPLRVDALGSPAFGGFVGPKGTQANLDGVYHLAVLRSVERRRIEQDGDPLSEGAAPYGLSFRVLEADDSAAPHVFRAYEFDSNSAKGLDDLARGCLRAWRLGAAAYGGNLDGTGFDHGRVIPLLNSFGIARLPPVPVGKDAIKSPVVADVTEILAVKYFREHHPEVILPAPRVFHKELPHIQHHGIDLVGYVRLSATSADLFIVEVMATASPEHPPDVVTEKRHQLLGETLEDHSAIRLMRELTWLHAESTEGDREILNALIIDTELGRLGKAAKVIATPLLVTPSGSFQSRDWSPFRNSVRSFERAYVPSTVRFVALCPKCEVLELVAKVRDIVLGRPVGGAPGGS